MKIKFTERKSFSWLVVLAISIVMAFLSYGLFSLFGYDPKDGFLRKLGFLGVLVLQVFVPMAICNGVYLLAMKAERSKLDQAREQAENIRSIKSMIAKDEQK